VTPGGVVRGDSPGPGLQVEALVSDARRRAGAPDGQRPLFLDALEALATSLDVEAHLTPEGRSAVRGALVTSLVTQLDLSRRLAEHPEIERVPIERPVFVVGLLRTGTTLVHNLLAEHPGLRCPELWELMAPAAGRGAAERRAAIAAAESYVEDYFQHARNLPAIHFMDARRPDECTRLLANTFSSMIFWMRYRVPGYAEWLRTRDLAPAYAYHRAQLRHVLWRIPGDVVVLKCPFHVWSLDALLTAYPDARLVWLHRSPAAVVPSTCSLCAQVRGARSDRVDPLEIGRFWLGEVARVLDDLDGVRRPHLPGTPVLDVTYGELMRDPIALASRICEFIGVPMTAAADVRMRGYLAANPQHRHGVHRYTPEEFGLRAAELEDRFAGYRRAFGV